MAMRPSLAPLRSAVLLALVATAMAAAPAPASAAAPSKRVATAQKKHRAAVRARRRHRRQARRLALLRKQSSQKKVSSAVAVSSESSSLLFNGDQIGDFWINHSAPGAISEVPDPTGSGGTAIGMTVSDQDVYPITPTENPRAELLSPAMITAGEEVWLQTKFLVPTDYPTVPADGWVSLVSFYGAPFNGPSPFHLELAGDNLQWQRNGTYGYDVPWQAPLIRGSWNTVLVHERFATDGFVEMWVNGQQISFFSSGTYNPSHHPATTQLAMATMDSSNDEGANSAKIMQYRKLGMFSSGTIYFGALRLGLSRGSVEG